MKKIILSLILTTVTIVSCKAQEIFPLGSTVLDLPKDNFYVKDVDNVMDTLVGTWIYEDNNSEFKLVLDKFEMTQDLIKDNSFYDQIFGRYEYREGLQIIAEIPNITPSLGGGFSLHYDSPTQYQVVIRDVVSGKVKVGTFILTSPTTATMELRYSEGIVVGGPTGDWALPSSFTFVKQ